MIMALRSLLDPLFSKKFFRVEATLNHSIETSASVINFVCPSSEEYLPIFWAKSSLRESFQNGVMSLIDKLEAWGEKQHLINAQIESNLASFRQRFKITNPHPADYFPLYTTGIKELTKINSLLENGQAPLAVKKHLAKNLLLDLDKCGPGVLNPIINTALSLHTDMPSQFMLARTVLAQTIAIDAIRHHQSSILEQMPGEEMHWVNWLLNLYHADLGILYIVDSRATDEAFDDLSAEIKQTFQEQIAYTLSVNWLLERVIEQSTIWQYLSEMNPNELTPDDLANFNAWLNSYGPQPTFYLTDLIEETEDCKQHWHPEHLSILKHQLFKRFRLAGYVRNHEKRYTWEENGETITLCLPYKNNLELSYVLHQRSETPLIAYNDGRTEKERIAGMISLIAPTLPALASVAEYLNLDNLMELNILTNRIEYLPSIDRLLKQFPKLGMSVIWLFIEKIQTAYPWIEILLNNDLSITAEDAYSKLSNINWDIPYLPDFYSLISMIQTFDVAEKKKYFALTYQQIDESPYLLAAILFFFSHHPKDNIAHYRLATKLLKTLLDQTLNISNISHLLDSAAKLNLLFDVMNCSFKMGRYDCTISHLSFFTHKSEEELIAEQIQKHLLEGKDGIIDFRYFSEQARDHMQSAIQQYNTLFGGAALEEPRALAASI